MKYLLKTLSTFRVADENEALKLREELSRQPFGELTDFSYTTKYIKQKGEVIGEYRVVKATMTFNLEKEPDSCVDVYFGYPEAKKEYSENNETCAYDKDSNKEDNKNGEV